MSAPIEFDYTTDAVEMIAAGPVAFPEAAVKGQLWWVAGLFAIFLALAAWIFVDVLNGQADTSTYLWTAFLLFYGGALIGAALMAFFIQRRTDGVLAKTFTTDRVWRIRLSEDGLRLLSEDSDLAYRWTAMETIALGADMLVLRFQGAFLPLTPRTLGDMSPADLKARIDGWIGA